MIIDRKQQNPHHDITSEELEAIIGCIDQTTLSGSEKVKKLRDLVDKADAAWEVDEVYRGGVDSKDGEVEVDDGATVSRGDDPGAYVHAWVWVRIYDAYRDSHQIFEFNGKTIGAPDKFAVLQYLNNEPDEDQIKSSDVYLEDCHVIINGAGEVIWEVVETVKCCLCKEDVPAKTAHLHQGEYIGDECCWDERLRMSE